MIARARRYAASYGGFSPNARRFLAVTMVAGAATSLFWVDFNLYLRALGLDEPTIGIVVTFGAVAAVAVSLPASWASDRVGRRAILLVGLLAMAVALAGLGLSGALPALLVLSALYGAGQQTFFVVQTPFMAENSRPEHRSELYAAQFAIQTGTTFVAALAGGMIARTAAAWLGVEPNSAPALRVLVGLMFAFGLAAFLLCAMLEPDMPAGPHHSPSGGREPRSGGRRRPLFRLRVEDPGVYLRLLVPGFLIGLGAGQVIPFLNLYIERRFGLDIATLNAVFAVTSLGTMAAILLQPALAARYGKIGSVVMVQSVSIPFIVVLGYSPVFATVAVAMVIRNALMNAGNPIFTAFAMERVHPAERGTLAALMSITWSAAWALGGPWYALLQRELGFDAGYAIDFAIMIACYSAATAMYWAFFRDTGEVKHA